MVLALTCIQSAGGKFTAAAGSRPLMIVSRISHWLGWLHCRLDNKSIYAMIMHQWMEVG
jgi:hypothetical protein